MFNNLSKIVGIAMPSPRLFWKSLLLVMAYTFLVWWFDDHYFPKKQFLEAHQIMALTSVIIGTLLAFRTNSAYDRWWEGRKLWGQLVNDIRNLSIKSKVLLKASPSQQERIGRLLVAFPYALKAHLRGERPDRTLLAVDPRADYFAHLPLHFSELIYTELQNFKNNTEVDGFQLLLVDPHARALMDICGACERILKSPIAGSYKWMIWSWVGAYLAVVPWLLVPIFEGWTLVVMLIGSYYVIAIEFLAEEVEEPFGTAPNDLPLDALCQTIQISVREVTGCLPPEQWVPDYIPPHTA